MPTKHRSLNTLRLGKVITDILGLQSKREYAEGRAIVQAILTAMKKSLQNGESIKVFGLGFFKVVRKKERGIGHHMPYEGKISKYSYYHVIPEHNEVVFRPSPSIIKELNEPQS